MNIYLLIFYFTISILAPYQSDDFNFKINPLEYSFSLEIISDVLDKLFYYGIIIGLGELWVCFFVFGFLIPKKIFFDIVNSIIHVVLINILFYLAKGRVAKKGIDALNLIFINLLIFIGFYGYSGLAFNITGSINQIWTHTFTLAYFATFLAFWNNSVSFSGIVSFFIFGIISGCGLEGAFFGQLTFFVIMYIFKFKKESHFAKLYSS